MVASPFAFLKVQMKDGMQRTDWAEQFAEDFYSRPLVKECVFHSARHLVSRIMHGQTCAEDRLT